MLSTKTDVRLAVLLWLDDIRPAPEGWAWCKDMDEAKKFVLDKQPYGIHAMSLDHDLGACENCQRDFVRLHYPEADFDELRLDEIQSAWLQATDYKSMPQCEHAGTGYQFVRWLEENPNYWPEDYVVRVHSSNPVGRARMEQVINAHYRGRCAKPIRSLTPFA